MVLIHCDERSATLRAAFKPRPTALIAIAFWLGAPLPLVVPARSDVVHYAFSALLVAIGFALALSSLRRAASRLEFDQRILKADDRIVPMAHAREIVLSGSNGVSEEVFDPTYRAELVLESGQRELLLEYHEPARVLRDLSELLPRLNLPVRLGWGLPEGARPWESQGAPLASARSVEAELEPIEVEPSPSARRPALALIIGAIVLATLQAILITSAVRRASNVSALSLALSVSSVITVLLIGLIIWSRRIVVTAGPKIAIQVRIFGIDVGRLGEAKAPLHGAWPVSPDGRTPRHVLIATEAGPVSVPCDGDAAAALAHKLMARAPAGAV
jgi:hypothetical protein